MRENLIEIVLYQMNSILCGRREIPITPISDKTGENLLIGYHLQKNRKKLMQKKKSKIPIQENTNNQDPTTWALPDGAIARLGRGREPDISFSPDGKYIGIGTSLGLWLYECETLAPTALWETARGMVGKIAFSPNGKWIAASNSDKMLKVLDVSNGACISKVKTEDYISGLTFSHDNKYISAAHACSSVVEVFHAETCEQFARLAADPDDAGFYRPLCFSPDNRHILSTYKSVNTPNADAVAVWDVEKRQQVTSLYQAHTLDNYP